MPGKDCRSYHVIPIMPGGFRMVLTCFNVWHYLTLTWYDIRLFIWFVHPYLMGWNMLKHVETRWNTLKPSTSYENMGIAVLKGVAISGGSPGSRGQQGQGERAEAVFPCRCCRWVKHIADGSFLSIGCISGWCFGTFLFFHILGNIGNNHPNWLIFFRGVETTNLIWLYDGFELLNLFEDAVNISELIELAGISDQGLNEGTPCWFQKLNAVMSY